VKEMVLKFSYNRNDFVRHSILSMRKLKVILIHTRKTCYGYIFIISIPFCL